MFNPKIAFSLQLWLLNCSGCLTALTSESDIMPCHLPEDSSIAGRNLRNYVCSFYLFFWLEGGKHEYY